MDFSPLAFHYEPLTVRNLKRYQIEEIERGISLSIRFLSYEQ
jgi:hypothetical protein